MYVSAENIEPQEVEIEELSSSDTGKIVTVEGEVVSSSFRKNNLFLTVEDGTGRIKIVMFDATKNIREGERAVIEGEVTLYRGELEIIADSISRKQV